MQGNTNVLTKLWYYLQFKHLIHISLTSAERNFKSYKREILSYKDSDSITISLI